MELYEDCELREPEESGGYCIYESPDEKCWHLDGGDQWCIFYEPADDDGLREEDT